MTDQPALRTGPQPAADAAPGFALAMIVLSTIGFGLVPLFAKPLSAAGIAPPGVAFYRYAFSALIFLPWLWMARHQWRALLWGAAGGLAMGLGWVAYVAALEIAPVSTLAVIYMTYPAFTLLICWLAFGERPGRRAICAALLVIIAAGIAASPSAIAPAQLPAVLMALLAPFGFGLAISALVHRLQVIAPLARVASTCLGAFLGVLPLVLATPAAEVLPGDAAGWALVFGIALTTAFLPQLLYVVYAPRIGAARAAVAGSFELPTMFVIGWLVFGEALGPTELLAGALILVAMLMPQTRATRNVTQNISTPRRRHPRR